VEGVYRRQNSSSSAWEIEVVDDVDEKERGSGTARGVAMQVFILAFGQ
jgi:hypothetical protein